MRIRFSAPVLLLALGLALATPAAGREARFLEYPDIHGDLVLFSFDGDLWTVGVDGGTAARLTSHPGNEYAGSFSPDGARIAFSGGYDGGSDVYRIPVEGGEPERLTYRGSCRVVEWTPDGREVVFRAAIDATGRPITKLYAVSTEGHEPRQLPVPRGVLCSFSPDGTKMLYNRRGREEYYWKRYKGGQYQDIWLADLETGRITPVTEYVGKNSYPMWIGEKMYFVSDRGPSGIANLYSFDLATREAVAVTSHDDFDVQMPGTDGKRIVYLHAGLLHLFDPRTGKSERIPVNIPSDRWKLADRVINPKDYIHSMSVTDDGKHAVFEARGDVFLVPTDRKRETRNLTDTAGTRERYPQVSPDGKRVAFFSDCDGEYDLYVRDLEGDDSWDRVVEGLDRTVYHLQWSPDGEKILFQTKDFDLYYVDVATKELVLVDSSRQLKNDEFYWEVSDYDWSPDGKWIAYSFVQFNRNNKIFLHELESKRRIPLTDDFYDSMNPSFDAGGRYLYFLSYRDFTVKMDIYEDNHVIAHPVQPMVVQLRAGERPPFDDDAGGTEEEESAEESEDDPFRIDVDGIQDRIFPLPVDSGNHFYLEAGKGIVTWASVPGYDRGEFEFVFTPSGATNLTFHLFDMDAKKEVEAQGKIADWRISTNGEHLIVRRGDDYLVTPLSKACKSASLGDSLDLGRMVYTVKPLQEWRQIFQDTWRWYRDFFYDPGMHGRDWKAIGEKFGRLLPDLNSREDLNWLLQQMVGELCVSHTYVGGGDFEPRTSVDNPVFTGLLGADLVPDPSGYYRFETILGPTPYNRDLTSPLVRPDIECREGDFLIAIDGRVIRTPEPIHKHLQMTRGRKLTITVNSSPAAEGARTYEIEPIRSERALRYERWIADNIATVLEATDGEVGYLHLTAMGARNIGQFDKYWRAFRYKKGLVIDVRGNGGGWTEYFMIDKLERQMVAYNCLQNMIPFRYPGSVSNGKYVVLTDETNGSDGEAFVEHFKARKLGTVIGVPSWGGLVGIINGQRTIDNGTVHQSNNSFYGREGKWLVENHGADPDILVENDPESRMAGRDLQLETAIRVLLEQIEEDPYTFPEKPDYPKK
jgi:tricorn protease